MILLTSSTIALLPVYVVPFHPFNKQQPYGCVCMRECISLCLTNGSVCEKDTSPIAYVIRSLCLAHCAHDIYHCTVSAGKIIDRPFCVYICKHHGTNPVLVAGWIFLCFVIVCSLSTFLSLACFHRNSHELENTNRIIRNIFTTRTKNNAVRKMRWKFIDLPICMENKMIENELSINAENSHRPILEWSIQMI